MGHARSRNGLRFISDPTFRTTARRSKKCSRPAAREGRKTFDMISPEVGGWLSNRSVRHQRSPLLACQPIRLRVYSYPNRSPRPTRCRAGQKAKKDAASNVHSELIRNIPIIYIMEARRKRGNNWELNVTTHSVPVLHCRMRVRDAIARAAATPYSHYTYCVLNTPLAMPFKAYCTVLYSTLFFRPSLNA